MSYRNVFDLMSTMNNLVEQKFVSKVKEINEYSIIMDSTQDVSKREVTSIIVRYVEQDEEQTRPVLRD